MCTTAPSDQRRTRSCCLLLLLLLLLLQLAPTTPCAHSPVGGLALLIMQDQASTASKSRRKPPRSLSLSLSMSDAEVSSPLSSSRFRIPVHNFREYVREVLESTDETSFDGYDQEMEELHRRSVSCLQLDFHASRGDNAKKNRYFDVLPYAHSRVRLSMVGDDPNTDYINANYIRGNLDGSKTVYISTQAPIPLTIPDFWRMIWEQESNIIVMLTPFRENHRVKSIMYWHKDPSMYISCSPNLKVRLHSTEFFGDCVHRRLELSVSDGSQEPRMIDHIQYLGWPDHGVPENFSSFHSLIDRYRQLRDRSSGPVVVHCSAGIGRSGTFIVIDIALDYMKHVLDSGDMNSSLCLVDAVHHMRTQRVGMVQTKCQYRFIYNFLDFCFADKLFGLELPAPE